MTGKRKADPIAVENDSSKQPKSSAADDWAAIMAAASATGASSGAILSATNAFAAANAATNTATPPTVSPTKKRPYRRTKRPVNYNDKSTITVSTPAAREAQTNVYDAVLAEADDLMRAATEAQSLGRLKMASNYLLLLHSTYLLFKKKWGIRVEFILFVCR